MEQVKMFDIGGKQVSVPMGEMEEFQKTTQEKGVAPQENETWTANGQAVTVPAQEREAFLSKAQETGTKVEQIHYVQVKGQTVSVPQSETEKFLKAYDQDPETEPERKKALEDTAKRISQANGGNASWGGLMLQNAGEDAKVGMRIMRNTLTSVPRAAVIGTANMLAIKPATFAARIGETIYGAATGKDKDMAVTSFLRGLSEELESPTVNPNPQGGWDKTMNAMQGIWAKVNQQGEMGGDTSEDSKIFSFTNELQDFISGLYGIGQAARGLKSMGGDKAAQGAFALKYGKWMPGVIEGLFGAGQAEDTAARAMENGDGAGKALAKGIGTGAFTTALFTLTKTFGVQKEYAQSVKGILERSWKRAAADVLGQGAQMGGNEFGVGNIEKAEGVSKETEWEIGKRALSTAAMAIAAGALSEGATRAAAGMRERRQSNRELANTMAGSAIGPDALGKINEEREPPRRPNPGENAGTGTQAGTEGPAPQGGAQAGTEGPAPQGGAQAGTEGHAPQGGAAPQPKAEQERPAAQLTAPVKVKGGLTLTHGPENLTVQQADGGTRQVTVVRITRDGKPAYSADPDLVAFSKFQQWKQEHPGQFTEKPMTPQQREEAKRIEKKTGVPAQGPVELIATDAEGKPFATQSLDVDKITLSPDVPQFKEGANPKTGENKPLTAKKFNQLQAGEITVWQRLNGNMEVITGRHRLALAKRTGTKKILCRVIKEADGYGKEWAQTFDAESNILDGQGSVRDYANFFRNAKVNDQELRDKGVLDDSRSRGKTGYIIGKYASEDLYSLYRNERLGEQKTAAIAGVGRGDDAMQKALIQYTLDHPGVDANGLKRHAATMRLMGKTKAQRYEQGDMFGGTDWDLTEKKLDEAAGRIEYRMNEERKTLQNLKGLAKSNRAKIAKKYGVNVEDADAVAQRLAAIEERLARWNDVEMGGWSSMPEFTQEVEAEAGITVRGKPLNTAAPEEKPFELKTGTPDEVAASVAEEKRVAAARKAVAEGAARPLTDNGEAAQNAAQLQMDLGPENAPTDLFGNANVVHNQSKPESGVMEDVGAETPKAKPGERPAQTVARTTSLNEESVRTSRTYHQDSAGVEGTPQSQSKGSYWNVRDAVFMIRELMGKLPGVAREMKPGALGHFVYRGDESKIEILGNLFGLVAPKDVSEIDKLLTAKGYSGKDLTIQREREISALIELRKRMPNKAVVKVMTHELSHLIDWLPDHAVGERGNILNHISAMKKFWNDMMPEDMRSKERPITKEEKNALRGRISKEVDALAEKVRAAFLSAGSVTPNDIKALLLDGAQRKPRLYEWFQALSRDEKVSVMKEAMKGVVSQNARKPLTRDELRKEVSRRYQQALEEEISRRQMATEKVIREEAKNAIPKWRGAEGQEEHFQNPAEIYAEMQAMFLSDPQWMQDNAPLTYRTMAGWMDARPDVRKAYDAFIKARDDDAGYTRFMRQLDQDWSKETQLNIDAIKGKIKTGGKSLPEAFVWAFDSKMGPVEMGVNRMLEGMKLEREQRKEKRAKFRNAEEMSLNRSDVIRLAVQQMTENASKTLQNAGLDWNILARYAFANRVFYETYDKANARGYTPDTAHNDLAHMKEILGPERYAALQRAWVEFRAPYEERVLNDPAVRRMWGKDMMDKFIKNNHYVTYNHIPEPEELENVRKGIENGMYGAADLVMMGLNHLDDAVKGDIKPLEGSFSAIKNPVISTVQKAAAILDAAYRNDLKIELAKISEESGDKTIRQAQYTHGTKGPRPVEVSSGGEHTLAYMQDGKMKAIIVPDALYQSFTKGTLEQNRVFVEIKKFGNKIAQLMTTLNYGFFERNYERDKQAAVNNIPGMRRNAIVQFVPVFGRGFGMITRYLPSRYMQQLPKWLWNDKTIEYQENDARQAAILLAKGGIGAAQKRVDELFAQGRDREAERLRYQVSLAQQGLSMGVLMNQGQIVRDGDGMTDLDKLGKRYAVQMRFSTDDGLTTMQKIYSALKAPGEWLNQMGEIREDTTKLASLAYMLKNSGLSADRIATAVRDWGGSPNFSRRGQAASVIETFFGPFLNAKKEGVMRSYRAMNDHPADWMLKQSVYIIAPAVIKWALGSGILYSLFKDRLGEDNPFVRYLRWFGQKWSCVNDYFAKNYITVPLPVSTGKDDTAVVATVPLDEQAALMQTLTFNALDGIAEAATGNNYGKTKSLLGNSATSLYTSMMPDIDARSPLINVLNLLTGISGNNATDSFHDQQVWTQREIDARWSSRAFWAKLAGNLSNALGGGMFYNYQPDQSVFNPEEIPLSRFLNIPVVQPTLGKYIRVVHRGQQQAQARIEGKAKSLENISKQKADEDFRRYLKEGRNLSPDIQNRIIEDPIYSDEWQNLMQKAPGKLNSDSRMEAYKYIDRAKNTDAISQSIDYQERFRYGTAENPY